MKCGICGREFMPVRSHQYKCPSCAKLARRTCAICDQSFVCRNSSPARSCEACRSEYIRRTHKGGRPWSAEKKARRSEEFKTARRKELEALQATGTKAARESPVSGPFETNRNAKIWRLKSPDGVEYQFANLNLFIRNHPAWFPNARSARTALGTVARCLFGPAPPSR